MAADLEYLAVNWIDGMKISREHFLQTENYLAERLQDTASLNVRDFSCGILPGEKTFKLNVICDANQQITVDLLQCKAVTANGSRIEVRPADQVRTTVSFKEIVSQFNLSLSAGQNLYVMISINTFNRIATGEPVLEENPPRHPFTRAEIKLDVVPAEFIQPAELPVSLIIGKIQFLNGELQVQKTYIPPSANMDSNELIADWYARFRELLTGWEQYLVSIIRKIYSRAEPQHANSLTAAIQKVSEKMLEQLMRNKMQFQWILCKSSPIAFMAELLANIHFCWAVMQCLSGKDREEILNYFAEWTDTAPGALELATARALSIKYDHADILHVLTEIELIYQQYVQIFYKLSLLDFIGKKKGQNIFVIEQEVRETKNSGTPAKPPGRWSPLS